ncbi:MAG: hypothetical protein ACRDP1_01875, partial [Nocardioidaceae bacterium]
MNVRVAGWVLVGVGVAVLVIGFATLGVLTYRLADTIRATQQDTSPTLRHLAEISHEIADCTTPGGVCFDRASRAQAQVVGRPSGPINDVIVLAAFCASRHPAQTLTQIRGCVVHGLAGEKR